MTKITSKDSDGRVLEVNLQTVDFEVLFMALNSIWNKCNDERAMAIENGKYKVAKFYEGKMNGADIVLDKLRKVYNWEYDDEEEG